MSKSYKPLIAQLQREWSAQRERLRGIEAALAGLRMADGQRATVLPTRDFFPRAAKPVPTGKASGPVPWKDLSGAGKRAARAGYRALERRGLVAPRPRVKSGGGRRFDAAHRKALSAAQKRRWARAKAAKALIRTQPKIKPRIAKRIG